MAGELVNLGAILECSFGTVPMTLIVESTVLADGPLAANIAASIPMDNIPFFVMCQSMANPSNATFSVTGVYAPCIPVTAPWAPGMPTILLAGMPALDSSSKCLCCWGVEITAVTVDTVELS